jgi:uncharacterized membrane protein
MLGAMMRQLLIFVHLSSVIIWVGGMFFAYFCLRPAAVQLLDPPKRLPLWAATFKLFLRYAAYAVALVVLSGFAMFLQSGFKYAPLGWHIMMTLGLVMAGVFVHVYAVLYPRLRRHCEAGEWPLAATALNKIRQMVALNLLLSLCTVAAAMAAR